MKIKNAISKLQKHGFTVTQDEGRFTAKKENCSRVVEFRRNGWSDEATCIGYRHESDHSDPMSDYCATMFCESLIGAIRSATR